MKDRLIKELKLGLDEIQRKFSRIIRDFNNLINLYGDPEIKEKWKVSPSTGTVAFGSALHRWGFTVDIAQSKDVKFSDIVEAYKQGSWKELQKTIQMDEATATKIVEVVLIKNKA